MEKIREIIIGNPSKEYCYKTKQIDRVVATGGYRKKILLEMEDMAHLQSMEMIKSERKIKMQKIRSRKGTIVGKGT